MSGKNPVSFEKLLDRNRHHRCQAWCIQGVSGRNHLEGQEHLSCLETGYLRLRNVSLSWTFRFTIAHSDQTWQCGIRYRKWLKNRPSCSCRALPGILSRPAFSGWIWSHSALSQGWLAPVYCQSSLSRSLDGSDSRIQLGLQADRYCCTWLSMA